jgi:acyl-CoA thioesterase-1
MESTKAFPGEACPGNRSGVEAGLPSGNAPNQKLGAQIRVCKNRIGASEKAIRSLALSCRYRHSTHRPRAFARPFAAFLFVAASTVLPAVAEPITIVALGDSNTNGDGVGRAYAWPAQLEQLLRQNGHDVRILNAGVSGDTTAEGLARLDQAVPDGTDAAIVFLGRNDLRLRRPETTIRENLTAILSRLSDRDIAILLVGFEPYDFSDIAQSYSAAYYPDFFAGVTRNGRKRARYTLPLDPVRHLNPSGYRVIANQLLPAAEDLIASANNR